MIPEDVLTAWREAGRRSLPDYEAWQARVAALPADKRRTLDRLREGRLPEGWEAPLRAFKRRAGEERLTESGIKTSGDILDLLTDAIPELLSGAPDLEGATQHKRRLRAFTAEDRGGRYVHYGIREHAMGAMLNGMAAHGGVILRRHLPGLHRLHAGGDAHGGHDGPAGAVRVQHDSIGIGTTGRRTSPWSTWRRSGRCPTCSCCARPTRSRRPSAGKSR